MKGPKYVIKPVMNIYLLLINGFVLKLLISGQFFFSKHDWEKLIVGFLKIQNYLIKIIGLCANE